MRRAAPLAAALLALAWTQCAAAPGRAGTGGAPLLPGGDAHAPVSVRADKLEYFSKERKAVYSGHVVARQGEGELSARSLTIFFSAASGSAGAGAGPGGQENSQVIRMDAAGPVTITEKDQVGVGDSATYERAANQVVLDGNVSLTQGSDIVKGDRLIYDLNNGQAQVVGRVSSLFVPGSGGPAGPSRSVAPKAHKNEPRPHPRRAPRF